MLGRRRNDSDMSKTVILISIVIVLMLIVGGVALAEQYNGDESGISEIHETGAIEEEKQIKEEGVFLEESLPLYNYIVNTSTDSVVWGTYINRASITELAKSYGKKHTAKQNIVFEDTLSSEAILKDIQIQGCAYVPVSDTNSTPSALPGVIVDVTLDFNKLEPKSGETYEAFKRKITESACQYGIYKDEGGNKEIIINFGSIPGDCMNFSDILSDTDVGSQTQYVLGKKAVSWAKKEIINGVLGEKNAIGGAIPAYSVYINTQYPVVLKKTQRRNIAYVSINGSKYQANATAEVGGVISRMRDKNKK